MFISHNNVVCEEGGGAVEVNKMTNEELVAEFESRCYNRRIDYQLRAEILRLMDRGRLEHGQGAQQYSQLARSLKEKYTENCPVCNFPKGYEEEKMANTQSPNKMYVTGSNEGAAAPSLPSAEELKNKVHDIATRRKMIRLSFSNTRRIVITECEWKDIQVAIRDGDYSYGCFDGAEEVAGEATLSSDKVSKEDEVD